MNVLGNADLQIFELEHPHLLAIWRAEAKMREKTYPPYHSCGTGMLTQMQQAASNMFGGLFPR